MEEKIKKILSQRTRREIATEQNVKPAAVLVPIFKKEEAYYVVLTKRTGEVEHHKQQISFPGGAYDEVDGSLENTALRESKEEIGLNPENVHVLGTLDDVKTYTSKYIITPFIAFIPYPYKFKKNDKEVEEIIEIPVSVLFEKDNKDKRNKHFVYEKHVIWGATGMILKQLIDLNLFIK